MEDRLREILILHGMYGIENVNEAMQEILLLFGVSKRHLIESILDDVKQSHSEYAVEKIESYLDDGC